MNRKYAKTGNWVFWVIAISECLWFGQSRDVMPIHSAAEAAQVSTQNQGLKFESQKLLVGEVRAGVPLTCQFEFANIGPNVVEITELRPGCGCLKPRLEQTRFGPNERKTLPVELQTLGQPAGPHTWHLTVVYRDGSQLREQALQVIATVVTEVSVQPTSLTLFTQGTLSHEITVTDLRPQPLRILRVESTSSYLDAKAGPFVKNDGGQFTAKIAVSSTGSLPAGRHEEQLVIYTTDSLYKEFRIPITIVKDAARRITSMPAELTLTSTRLVRLRDSLDQPVVIENVTSDDATLSFHWASGPGNQVTLKVTLDEAAMKVGPSAATISIQIASPVREVVAIPVRW